MNDDGFSVLMCVYYRDNALFLAAALESLCCQTLQPSEIVLVEDGPLSPSLEQVVLSYEMVAPIKIKVVKLDSNVGLGEALRRGLLECEYRFVARMDADDISVSDRFEKQYSYLVGNPDVAVVGGFIEEFKEEPGDLARVRKVPLSSHDVRKFAIFRCPVNHPSVMYRRSVILSVNSYEHVPQLEDYYLWVKLLHAGYSIENMPATFVHYRVGNDMIGRRHGYSYLKNEYRFYRRVRELGFLEGWKFWCLLIIRLPMRLLPKTILNFVYANILR